MNLVLKITSLSIIAVAAVSGWHGLCRHGIINYINASQNYADSSREHPRHGSARHGKTFNRPNIVLIYIDDLGYSDLGCYGREYGADFIETPNIDQFAKQSMKFTNAYAAAPLCSPSRAAILTGKTPARLQFEFVTKWEKDRYRDSDTAWKNMFRGLPMTPPVYKMELPLAEQTVAEMLKGSGYTTAIAGKWHLAPHHLTYNGWSPELGPAQQGFEWTADEEGAFAKTNEAARKKARPGEYPEDSLTTRAISFLQQPHRKPFFLYLSHYYVHTPLHTDLKWLIEKYRKKAAAAGIHVSDKRIRYAAFVETMDHYVGRFLDSLQAANLSENTMVVFTSDNGGMPEFAYNRPFRGSKWNLYEGGIRIPMLIRYPGIIQSNAVSDEPVTQMDLFPTFYKLATGEEFAGSEIDGKDISAVLKGNKQLTSSNRALFWHFPYYHPEGKAFDTARHQIGTEDEAVSQTRPQSAIRKGNYKLIYYHERGNTELYNLQTDPGEQKDLTKQQSKIAQQLKNELLAYLQKVKARMPTHPNIHERPG